MTQDKTFLTVPEISRLMGLSVARCYQLVAEGRVPYVRRGRRILVPTEAWRKWVAAQTDRAMSAMGEDNG